MFEAVGRRRTSTGTFTQPPSPCRPGDLAPTDFQQQIIPDFPHRPLFGAGILLGYGIPDSPKIACRFITLTSFPAERRKAARGSETICRMGPLPPAFAGAGSRRGYRPARQG